MVNSALGPCIVKVQDERMLYVLQCRLGAVAVPDRSASQRLALKLTCCVFPR